MTPTLFDLALKAGFSDPIEGWMGEAYEERLEAFAKLIIDYEIATKIANVTGELTNDALRQAMDYSMPLYTTPPAAQRQWVGLTDKQVVDAIEPLYVNRSTAEMAANVSMDEFRAIEAKIKEQNT